MINARNIDKYYNKNRRNENHVLRDISLDFPQKGMVMLLGDSGSGKTTLLNVMGGLDKADKGQIEIKNETLDRYQPRVWDKLRNRHIGYVFQNYYLLPQETVYDNIKLTLKMIGITDAHLIEKRINHLLKLVGMPQYKNRKANQLSGGQQQRVAIVRALAKNPDVIIADEPTGNLDSKNTLAVMRLLKQISKDKLVIMVTHEERLAKHYADEIIHIEDGKIRSKEKNRPETELDTTTETDIYLGDLEKKDSGFAGDDRIELYTDGSQKNPVKGRLIIQNNTLYLDIDAAQFKNIHVLKEDADTVVHEAKREEVAEREETLPAIDYERFTSEQEQKEPSSVISAKHALSLAFHKIRSSTKLSKLLYFAFAFSAAIFALALSLFSSIIFIDDHQFLTEPTYTFEVAHGDFGDLEAVEAMKGELFSDYNFFTGAASITFTLPRFYQTPQTTSLSHKFAPRSLISENDISHGSFPASPNEIAVSSQLARVLLENSTIRSTGITTRADLLKLTYTAGGQTFNISGVAEGDAPVFYASESLYYSTRFETLAAAELYEDVLEIVRGRYIGGEMEMVVSERTYENQFADQPFEPYEHTHNDMTFTVVGTYTTDSNDDAGPNLIRTRDLVMFAYRFTSEREPTFYLYTDAPREAERELSALGIDFTNRYATQHEAERQSRLAGSGGLFIFSLVAMGASALSYYFIIRSSMLNRIYEIGVYRALGVGRLDITKMFFIEILLLTTLSSMIGYAAMSYVLRTIARATADFVDALTVSFFTIILGVILIYLINTIFGLLPLFRLLRKTPAQIHSHYDL